MSDEDPKPGRDSRGRFTKGASPNAKGRRKKTPEPPVSALDLIFSKNVRLTAADGGIREMSAEEAVRHSTLQDALKGKAGAINRVTNWIVRREKARAKEADRLASKARSETSSTRFVSDPENADEVLVILGIATRDEDYEASVGSPRYMHLKLEPWAVQAALSRRRSSDPFSNRDIREIERCSRLPEDIRWPAGTQE